MEARSRLSAGWNCGRNRIPHAPTPDPIKNDSLGTQSQCRRSALGLMTSFSNQINALRLQERRRRESAMLQVAPPRALMAALTMAAAATAKWGTVDSDWERKAARADRLEESGRVWWSQPSPRFERWQRLGHVCGSH